MSQATDQHLPPETLVAYHERRLSEGESEDVRAHLAACPDCTAELLELAALFDGPNDQGDEDAAGTSRQELDDAWERQRGRLPVAAPMAAVVPLESRRPASSRPAWLAAASMGLAAALLGFIVIGQWRTIEHLRQPRANPPLVNLEPVDSLRRGGQPLSELTLQEGTERVWVILNPSEDPGASPHDVEIAAADGEVVLRLRDLNGSEAGNFRLEIPGATLKTGDYKVRLIPKEAGPHRVPEEFDLRVRLVPPHLL